MFIFLPTEAVKAPTKSLLKSEELIDLTESINSKSPATITRSSLISRCEDSALAGKGPDTNKGVKHFCKHSIATDLLNRSGLYLNKGGTLSIVQIFLNYLRVDYDSAVWKSG